MRISHRESLSEKGFGLFTATAAFTKRRLKERCEDAPSARRRRIVWQQFSLFSQMSCFEQLTSIKCWKHSFFFFKVNKSVMRQAEVYFVPPGPSVTSFSSGRSLWYTIKPMEKLWFWFFLCILLKTVFFQSRFLPLPAGLQGLMWFMTVAPDMHHHHPTFRVQNGCKLFFLFSFASKQDSPEHCDTGVQFTFVSFIKWRAQHTPPPASFLFTR